MRARVAVLRGEALNPFEMQAYAPLAVDFDMLAVGRRNPDYEVGALGLPTRLLPSVSAVPRLAQVVDRASKRWQIPDPGFLLGLRAALGHRDILHSAETVLPVSEQAADLCVGTATKLVLTCWENIPFRYDDDPRLSRRKDKVRAAADLFLAVTPLAADALRAEGVAELKIKIIPAGVDCARFAPLGQAPTALRRRLGIPAGSTLVLYVGRLIAEKGVVELVRAVARLADRSCHLVVVGKGDQVERIRRAAAEGGVSERIHVVDSVGYADVPALYAEADVVVAPSLPTPYWEEQFGMVLVEAMASGRPLVSTSSGSIPDVVGDAALLVPPYDVDALSGALDTVLADGDLRALLSSSARQRSLERYDVPVVTAQLRQAYEGLLA